MFECMDWSNAGGHIISRQIDCHVNVSHRQHPIEPVKARPSSVLGVLNLRVMKPLEMVEGLNGRYCLWQ